MVGAYVRPSLLYPGVRKQDEMIMTQDATGQHADGKPGAERANTGTHIPA